MEVPPFDALQNIIDDNERVEALLVSDDGLTRAAGDREQQVALTVAMVVTDLRVLFVTVDSDGDDTGSLAYGDLAAIEIADGGLELTTTDGVVWRFPIDDPESEAVEAACRHLSWIGDVRSRLKSLGIDVDLAVGEMDAYADDLEWEDAEETYREARRQLDDLICTVQATEPLADDVLAPGLAGIERTLEGAYAHLYVRRAESQLELGRQLVDNEDYQQARKVLEQAQQYYERARDRSEAVERGDAFRFGTQRELQNELEDLGWEIETVAAEPIRQAHEAKIQAQHTDDPEMAIDYWEQSFRRYGNVLTLEWGDDERSFAGDPREVREEMRHAADRLIKHHQTVAEAKWNDGVGLEQRGEFRAAVERCEDATEHLERAHELSAEFEPGTADRIAAHLEKMLRTLIEIRDSVTDGENGTEGQDQSDGTPADADGSQAGDGTSRRDGPDRTDSSAAVQETDDWPPSLADLNGIDTHHEITLSAEGITRQSESRADETDADGTAESEQGDDADEETDTRHDETEARSEHQHSKKGNGSGHPYSGAPE